MSLPPSFLETLRSPAGQAVIWGTVLVCMLMVGAYLVKKFRDRSGGDRLTANQLLTNFREMERGGDITDSEFRTIKTVLGERLQAETRDSSETS